MVKAFRESEDYKNYKAAAEEIKKDPSAVQMLKDFRNKNFEIQKQQMQGEQPSQEQVEQLQKTVWNYKIK